jgi:aspartyl-tRNA(Asn)/glutamyl-tRNA(Gln) amidotransferase subunit A
MGGVNHRPPLSCHFQASWVLAPTMAVYYMNEIHYFSITELARAYRDRSLSPVEVCRTLLDRIQQIDPVLKAFIRLTPERALAEAERAEQAWRSGDDPGPLCGIPYAVKDLFDVRDFPTTAGTSLLEHHRAEGDAWAVRRLAAAGMVLIGKTHTVQFAYGGVGINHDLGTPHNPWKREPYVPGGSSSGSAVAVSTGLVPAALGTDTAGSVRIPASLCGLVGLKTTFGRIGRTGVYPLSFHLDSIGPLTRTVEEAALITQGLLGTDPRDEATRWAPAADLLTDLSHEIRGLRLGLAESIFFDQSDPPIEGAVREAARVFQSLGAPVEPFELPEAAEILTDRNAALFTAAEACVVNRDFLDRDFEALDPVVANRMIGGRKLPATDYIATWRQWLSCRERALQRLGNLDALLVPTTCLPALPLFEVDRTWETYQAFNAAYLRNTFIGSVLQWCGISLPCGFTDQGLPIGLMIYGRPFQEALILRLARAYERATVWHKRRPDLSWAAGEDGRWKKEDGSEQP